MIKNKFFSFFISCSFALPLLLTGCKNNNDSIATKPVDYEATFIESDKTVSETKIKVYEGPKTFTSSDKCKVSVEGQELFVYETLVNYNRQFTWSTEDTKAPVVLFDFEGKVHMEVEINTEETITTASLSPLAYQIPIAIDGNKLSFDLEYQSNYVLTFNDDYKTAIHIFTNEIEDDEITEEMAKNDDSIVYIGPGLYKADTIPVKDNSTIYLAGGAFVYGDIHGEVVENLTIKGHGIISGDIYTRTSDTNYTVHVVLSNAKHIVLEDITF